MNATDPPSSAAVFPKDASAFQAMLRSILEEVPLYEASGAQDCPFLLPTHLCKMAEPVAEENPRSHQWAVSPALLLIGWPRQATVMELHGDSLRPARRSTSSREGVHNPKGTYRS